MNFRFERDVAMLAAAAPSMDVEGAPPARSGAKIDLYKVFAKDAFNLDRILEFEPGFPERGS